MVAGGAVLSSDRPGAPPPDTDLVRDGLTHPVSSRRDLRKLPDHQEPDQEEQSEQTDGPVPALGDRVSHAPSQERGFAPDRQTDGEEHPWTRRQETPWSDRCEYDSCADPQESSVFGARGL
jgi:hypothetical protein